MPSECLAFNDDDSTTCIPYRRMVCILITESFTPFNLISNFSGMHFKGNHCDTNFFKSTIDKLQQYLLDAHQMYPKTLSLLYSSLRITDFGQFGGWSDAKDHQLCLSFSRERALNTTLTND